MGIDCYLMWKGQTEVEREAQMTGFSIEHGHVGYLREAYHGSPYATRVLVPEGFEHRGEDGAQIPAATLRSRLPDTVLVTLYRDHLLYGGGDDPSELQDSLADSMAKVFASMKTAKASTQAIVALITPEQRRQATELIAARKLPNFALAFVDFVELAEKKENETGEPCRVVVSA